MLVLHNPVQNIKFDNKIKPLNFSVSILSSATGSPTDVFNQTALLLNIRNKVYLVDCGEATQFQLVKFKHSYMKIDHIFISHIHADHYIGLIGLLNTYNLNHRTNALTIFAPIEIQEIIEVQLRLCRVELRYTITFIPTQVEEKALLFENKDMEVISFPVVHRVPTTAFLFREKTLSRKIREDIQPGTLPTEAFKVLKAGLDFTDHNGKVYSWEKLTIGPPAPRSFAFITDTLYMPELKDIIKDVDLLYHEATFLSDLPGYADETRHSTAIQAATLARDANVGKLIIGHISTRYKDRQILLDEAKKIFPRTELASEGTTFAVNIGSKK